MIKVVMCNNLVNMQINKQLIQASEQATRHAGPSAYSMAWIHLNKTQTSWWTENLLSENVQQQLPVPSLVVSMGVQTGITSQTKRPTAKQQPWCLAVGNILSSKSLKNMSAMRERGEKRREAREKKTSKREERRARTSESENETERERERVGERATERERGREEMHPWHHPCFQLFLLCHYIVWPHCHITLFFPFLCQSSSGSIAFLSSATEE